MNNFIVGFLSSLLATIVAAYTLVLLSEKFRWFLTGILGRLAHHDIEFVFPKKEACTDDLDKEFSKSSKIYVLTSRGNELKRDPFKKLINEKPSNRKLDLRIILPKVSQTGFDFINQREDEIKTFDKAYGNGRLKDDIKTNIDYLMHIFMNDQNCGIKLSLANYPHFARIIITDDFLFLQPYNKNRHGEFDPVMKFRRGETYKAFARYFDLIWNSEKDEF